MSAHPAPLLLALVLLATPTMAADVPDDPKDVAPLPVGASIPDVTVRKPDGSDRRIDPDTLLKPTVLIFYRGGWCPYCNAHLGALSAAESDLISLGYEVIFLSADQPSLLYSSLKDPGLHYTLLSDATMQAARAYGVAFRVDDATVARYKTLGIDLEAASGQTHHELPVPAVFIIDREGVVRFVHADPDYKVRLSPDTLLAAARGVAGTN
jgi:peroxiredoxin